MWRNAVHGLLAVMLLWAVPTLCRAAAPAGGNALGMVTIVEGDVIVIRGAEKFAAVPGLRLLPDDIVHLSPKAKVAQIELDEGAILNLGPSTRALIQPRFAGAATSRLLPIYLGEGWAKLTSMPKPNGRIVILASPRLDVVRLTGTVVVHTGQNSSAVFVESGNADIVERRQNVAEQTRSLRDGETYTADNGSGGVTRGLPPDLLKSVPQPFVAGLPARAALFADKVVEPSSPSPIDFEDAAPWNDAEPAVRAAMRERWAAKVTDPALRTRLVGEPPAVAKAASQPEHAAASKPKAAPAVAARTPSPSKDSAVAQSSRDKARPAPGSAQASGSGSRPTPRETAAVSRPAAAEATAKLVTPNATATTAAATPAPSASQPQPAATPSLPEPTPTAPGEGDAPTAVQPGLPYPL